MHAEIATVLVEGFQSRDVGHCLDNFVDPFDTSYHLVPEINSNDDE